MCPVEVPQHFIACPVCGVQLQDQTWADRPWIDCPSMHRLNFEPAVWDDMCRRVLMDEIAAWKAERDAGTVEPDIVE